VVLASGARSAVRSNISFKADGFAAA